MAVIDGELFSPRVELSTNGHAHALVEVLIPTEAEAPEPEPVDETTPETADGLVVLAEGPEPGWEEEEPELESIARIEEHEGLEDHVRMHLREIGTVPLLSWEGEKRLARRMEEGV